MKSFFLLVQSIAVILFIAVLNTQIAIAKELPNFDPLDAGGVPSNLREINKFPAVLEGDVQPAGDYYIWISYAVDWKKGDNAWLTWDWQKYGPYKLLGGKRYSVNAGANGFQISEFNNPRYSQLGKGETCVRFENLNTDRWIATVTPQATSRPGMEIKGSTTQNPPVAKNNKKEAAPKESKISSRPVTLSAKELSIAGTWSLDANNYKGKIEFSSAGNNNINGRIYYDIAQKWESLTNVSFNPSTGKISFTRPWSGNPTFQQYKGVVSGNKISGSFVDNNTPNASYNWSANK